MRTHPVSIFIPVYNFNPEQLVRNIGEVHAFARTNYDAFEIVIIDDTSKEETKAAIQKATALKDVKVINYVNGPSRRENLAASFPKALYGTLCFMDIDLSTELRYLPDITDAIDGGYDIAVGSRYKGISPERERYRFIFSKLYNFTLRTLFRSKILDHTCGFKAFKKNAIVALLKELGYDTTGKRGWFWDAEMLIRAQREKYKVTEIPVKWVRDAESTFSFKRESKIVPYLVSYWMRSRFS